MINNGKAFENDFKKSVPSWCWIYRFKDGTANFAGGKNENVRFQASNVCDYIVMAKDKLYLLELKSHKGASIPFSCIRENQLKEMSTICYYNVLPMFVFNFREHEQTYAVAAVKVAEYIETSDRKSIPLDWCKDFGILINSEKKRTRYTYDLEIFFEED